MEIFFGDPDAIPLPPEEVRILDLQASPYRDGKRVRVSLEITPFQQRPSGELVVTDEEGTHVASISFIETIDPHMQFTIHLRQKDPGVDYTLTAIIFYSPDIESSTDEANEELAPIGEPDFTDRREVHFSVNPQE